jgi:hypothetical protein
MTEDEELTDEEQESLEQFEALREDLDDLANQTGDDELFVGALCSWIGMFVGERPAEERDKWHGKITEFLNRAEVMMLEAVARGGPANDE